MPLLFVPSPHQNDFIIAYKKNTIFSIRYIPCCFCEQNSIHMDITLYIYIGVMFEFKILYLFISMSEFLITMLFEKKKNVL
jgi:hypothetical protein